MQPDRARTAQSWLNGAEQDLEIARAGQARWPNAACFHAQQAAEKALKAVLVVASGDVVRTHALSVLLEELRETETQVDEGVAQAAKLLDKYYAPTRYPDALGEVDPTGAFAEHEAREAIGGALGVVEFAATRLREFEEAKQSQADS